MQKLNKIKTKSVTPLPDFINIETKVVQKFISFIHNNIATKSLIENELVSFFAPCREQGFFDALKRCQ